MVEVVVRERGQVVATFDLDPSLISVESLRLLVEGESGLEAARQRLVYRGRVLPSDGSVLLSTIHRTIYNIV